MSRVSWRPLPGLERPALVAAPGRDAVPRLPGARWLSDAIAGILLGISCGVVTALMVGQIQRRVEKRQGAAWK
jgi:hypothetical protein